MKKILALALAVAMSLSLVACGSNDAPAASTPAAPWQRRSAAVRAPS